VAVALDSSRLNNGTLMTELPVVCSTPRAISTLLKSALPRRTRSLSKEIAMMTRRAVCLILATVTACGCGQSLEDQTKKSPNSIIGKKTQEVGQFDPNANAKVSNSKIEASDPITAPTSAYGPMLERISKSHIEHAVNLFQATEGHYPKDHDEFMTQIIKANNIQLPVLPGGKLYQYDVENHRLVVIDAPAAAAPASTPAAAPAEAKP
jgi:hypothetical protein